MHIDATRITGIFDWGCQRWGDHHYDLAWFDFWSPWHPNLNVDLLRAALQARWAAAGYVPDHEASRTRACLINIGLKHLIYQRHDRPLGRTGRRDPLHAGTRAALTPSEVEEARSAEPVKEASFLLSAMGEGTFVSLLSVLERHFPDPVTRRVAHLTRTDEARHVAFSLAHLGRRTRLEPDLRIRLARAVEQRHRALRNSSGLNESSSTPLSCSPPAGPPRPRPVRRAGAAADLLLAWRSGRPKWQQLEELRPMTPVAVNDIPIIDTDTHVVEPPDLWTSRLSSKWGDLVPHVKWDDKAEEEAWFIGDTRLGAVGSPAMAGWHEHPPYHPRRFEDTDPRTWDATRRAGLMDEYNIRAQILYPNVAVFDAKTILSVADTELRLACIQAYNDFLVDFASEAPGRFIPVTGLPFWDLDLTLAEIERCAALGHKGIVFTQDPSYFGLPQLTDRRWDRMWRSAEEKGLPVNFHIASGDLDPFDVGHPDNGPHANYAAMGVSFFLANAKTIAQLVTGGICHRFPELNFVSVESGIGWIPFALEALDWQWQNCGVDSEHPEYDLLPSEYFHRQIYGCYWFERDSAIHTMQQIGYDNVLYETDFPHPTSMSPGPASTAQRPPDYLRDTFSGLDLADMRKVLHDNAARIYHLD